MQPHVQFPHKGEGGEGVFHLNARGPLRPNPPRFFPSGLWMRLVKSRHRKSHPDTNLGKQNHGRKFCSHLKSMHDCFLLTWQQSDLTGIAMSVVRPHTVLVSYVMFINISFGESNTKETKFVGVVHFFFFAWGSIYGSSYIKLHIAP